MFKMINEDDFKEEQFIKPSRSIMSNLIFRALLSGLRWEALIRTFGLREPTPSITAQLPPRGKGRRKRLRSELNLKRGKEKGNSCR